MTKLHFTGEFYSGEEYLFEQPGEVEVRDEKAEQLLQDFPEIFATIPATPERVEKSDAKDTAPESKPGKK